MLDNLRSTIHDAIAITRAIPSAFMAGMIANRCPDCIVLDEDQVIMGCPKHADQIAKLAYHNASFFEDVDDSDLDLSSDAIWNTVVTNAEEEEQKHGSKLLDAESLLRSKPLTWGHNPFSGEDT